MLRKFMSANFAVNSDRFSTEIRWYLEDLPAGLPGRDEVQEQMSGVIGDIQRLKVHLTEGEEHEQRQQKRYELGVAADRYRAARLKDKRRAGLTRKVETKLEHDHEQVEHAQALLNMQIAMGQLSVPPLQLDPPSAARYVSRVVFMLPFSAETTMLLRVSVTRHRRTARETVNMCLYEKNAPTLTPSHFCAPSLPPLPVSPSP
jgi:hypothetical protein